jgi:hypothetical protein
MPETPQNNDDPQCEHCGNRVLSPEYLVATVLGDSVCNDCTVTCDSCNRVYSDSDSDHIESVGRNTLCENCYISCEDCGVNFDPDHGYGHNSSGGQVCSNCHDDYMTCDRCCETIHVDDVRGYDGCGYCDVCYDEARSEDDYDDDYDRSRLNIYAYDARVPCSFFHGNKSKRTTRITGTAYFGVEVEVENPDACNSMLSDAAGDVSNEHFYCKSDGSLDNGFEVVSHPATLAAWRKRDLSRFADLASEGYRSYNTETAGMHIHVSRDSLTKTDQFKLLQFFKQNQEFVRKMARRRGRGMDQWAAIEDRGTREFVDKVKGGRCRERYLALNFQNAATIECRIFRGTLCPKAIQRNIEAFNAVLQFAKQTSLTRLTYTDLRIWLSGKAGRATLGRKAQQSLTVWFDTFDLPLTLERTAKQCA